MPSGSCRSFACPGISGIGSQEPVEGGHRRGEYYAMLFASCAFESLHLWGFDRKYTRRLEYMFDSQVLFVHSSVIFIELL